MAKTTFAKPNLRGISQYRKPSKKSTTYQQMQLGCVVVVDPYLSKKQGEGNVAGAIYKEVNGVVVERPIRGGVRVDIAQALTEMTGMMLKDITAAMIDSASVAMVEVLKRATSYAPFWEPQKRPRPALEGMHLRGSGGFYIGFTKVAGILNGGPGAVTPPDPMQNAGDMYIDWNAITTVKSKQKNRKISFTVEFNRIGKSGNFKGIDLATLIHEDLNRSYNLGGPKYLERAFNEVKPYENMQTALKKLVLSYKYPASRKRKIEQLIKTAFRKMGD